MRRRSALPSLLALILCLACFGEDPLLAQAPDTSIQNVTLRVRAIRAKGLRQNRVDVSSMLRKGKANSFSVDQGLIDLTSKFEQLPYRTYKLIMSREVDVPLKQKQTVRLQGGQILNVRLMYANSDKVGLWVHWLDKDGSALLDTRMHFTRAEAMLTGTDSSKNCAVILAMDVISSKPAEPSPTGK
jgi:hypothetical protein